jgi:hypothetical protein
LGHNGQRAATNGWWNRWYNTVFKQNDELLGMKAYAAALTAASAAKAVCIQDDRN